MDWKTYFSKQEQLDQYIIDNHELHKKDLFHDKMLALLVELGELANEKRSFKFWSEKEASPNSVILEEFVDNIHFLLSLGLEKKYRFSKIDVQSSKKNLTQQFIDVFNKALFFYKEQSEAAYISLFETYLQLGEALGFSEADIFKAYDKKNEVNYERQNQGY